MRPFTLSSQAIDSDIPKIALLFLSFPLLLGLSWAKWFLGTEISTYTISTDVSFSTNPKNVMEATHQSNTTRYTAVSRRELKAEFPVSTHVEVGENAIVQLDQYTLSGTVVEITHKRDTRVVTVLVDTDDMALDEVKTVQVWVVTGVVTPSDLVLKE